MHNNRISIDTRIQLLIENIKYYLTVIVRPVENSIKINGKFSIMQDLQNSLNALDVDMFNGQDQTLQQFSSQISHMKQEYEDITEKMEMLNRLSMNEIRLIGEQKNQLIEEYYNIKNSYESFANKEYQLNSLYTKLIDLMDRAHHFFEVYHTTSQDLIPSTENIKDKMKYMADLMPQEFSFDMKILEKFYMKNDISLGSIQEVNYKHLCTSLDSTFKLLKNNSYSKINQIEEGLHMMSNLMHSNDLFQMFGNTGHYEEIMAETANFCEVSQKKIKAIISHYDHILHSFTHDHKELNEFMYNTLIKYLEKVKRYEDWMDAKVENQKNIIGTMMEKSFELINSFMKKTNP